MGREGEGHIGAEHSRQSLMSGREIRLTEHAPRLDLILNHQYCIAFHLENERRSTVSSKIAS
jgi:hypothetical protein